MPSTCPLVPALSNLEKIVFVCKIPCSGFLKLESVSYIILHRRRYAQHVDHHDREYLQRVAGHVHHYPLHWYLLRRSQRNFPCFLQLQGVHFEFGWWLPSSDLRFLQLVSIVSPDLLSYPTCLADDDFEEE